MALKEPLPPKFLRKLATDAEAVRLELGFNSMNWREGHTFKIGRPAAAVNSSTPQLLGWDWQKLSAGNVALESLVLENQNLIYESSDYAGWSDFLQRFEQVALPILENVLSLVDISNLILEYIDRFVYDGPFDEAQVSDVLSADFVGLPAAAHKGPTPWHLHFGWFEEIEDHKLLINQNIDVQDGSLEIDTEVLRSLQIHTKMDLRPHANADNYNELRPTMDKMHDRSKQLVHDILTAEMRTRIGLESAENA